MFEILSFDPNPKERRLGCASAFPLQAALTYVIQNDQNQRHLYKLDHRYNKNKKQGWVRTTHTFFLADINEETD
jgi:hypothetical protein